MLYCKNGWRNWVIKFNEQSKFYGFSKNNGVRATTDR